MEIDARESVVGQSEDGSAKSLFELQTPTSNGKRCNSIGTAALHDSASGVDASAGSTTANVGSYGYLHDKSCCAYHDS